MEEKVAAAQQTLFSKVYVPALVDSFNKKAAAVGIAGIKTEADLQQAIELIGIVKQGLAVTRSQNNPLHDAHSKLASIQQQLNPSPDASLKSFAKAASIDADVVNALRAVVAPEAK
mgnify:CR=1 FL=1